MRLSDEVKVSLVAGICVLALAIVSKYFINTKLDFVSQYGPVWIFIVYTATRRTKAKSRICEGPLIWILTMVFATMGILLVYAL